MDGRSGRQKISLTWKRVLGNHPKTCKIAHHQILGQLAYLHICNTDNNLPSLHLNVFNHTNICQELIINNSTWKHATILFTCLELEKLRTCLVKLFSLKSCLEDLGELKSEGLLNQQTDGLHQIFGKCFGQEVFFDQFYLLAAIFLICVPLEHQYSI